MEQRDLTLIFQNANFDLRVLQGCGIQPRKLVHDTMLQSYLLTNGIPLKAGQKGHNNLAAIAKRELGVEVDKTLQSQNWMEAELTEADMRYAMGDVQLTWEAYHRMAPKIFEQGLTLSTRSSARRCCPPLRWRPPAFGWTGRSLMSRSKT